MPWAEVWKQWAVTEHFKDYPAFKPYEVCTDNTLTYISTMPNLDATGHRWVGALASFNFSLHYQKGAQNAVADALSQVPSPTIALAAEAVHSLPEGVVIGMS